LKTIGVGNGWDGDGLGDDYFDPSDDGVGRWFGANPGIGGTIGGAAHTDRKPDRKREGGGTPVELVFVPPFGSNYSVQLEEEEAPGEDIYHHRDAYLADGVGLRSPIPSVGITPASPARAANSIFTQPIVASPQPVSQGVSNPVDITEEDAYDYFRGPDLGEDFTGRRAHSLRKRSLEDLGGGAVLRYSLGGSTGVVEGRNSVQGDKMLEVPVNDEGDRGRETSRSGSTSRSRSEERSRSRSRSRTPSPLFSSTKPTSSAVPVTVPHVGSSHERPTSPPSSNALLSPPLRGRTPTVSEPQSRGRSSTRGSSSFSDRERSGSRGASSPIGSISPDGSIGIGIGAGRSTYAQIAGERGKERAGAGRVLNGSLSPDDSIGRVKSAVANGRRQSRSDSDTRMARTHPSASFSSSTAGSNPGPVKMSTPRSPLVEQYLVKPAPSIHIPVPVANPADATEEERRSRQPTPANSPIVTKKSSPISAPTLSQVGRATPPSKATTTNGVLEARAVAERAHDVDHSGTLVGRAVDMAGAFLGVIWQGHG
jgi:hypothetical protein